MTDETPRQAIWASRDLDIPVEVMPGPAELDAAGRAYQRVRYQGHESYVPLDELRETPEDQP